MSHAKAVYAFSRHTQGYFFRGDFMMPPPIEMGRWVSTSRWPGPKATITDIRKAYRTEPDLWKQAKDLGGKDG